MRRAVLLGMAAYTVAMVCALPTLLQRGSNARDTGWNYAPPSAKPQVTGVGRGGPAAGVLQRGDRILSIDGITDYRGLYGPDWQIWNYQPGREYRVRFLRGGETREATLAIVSRRDSSRVPVIACFLFGSVTFTLMAVLMGWQKPELLTARLGWLACQLTGLLYVELALEQVQALGWYPGRTAAVLTLQADWALWLGWWFVAEFPYSLPWTRWWRSVRAGLAVLCAVEWIFSTAFVVPFVAGPEWYALLPSWWMRIIPLAAAAPKVALGLAMAGVLVRNYRQMRDPASRRRLELVAGASAFAFVTIGAFAVAAIATGTQRAPLTNLAALPIPICFAYAVVRHRALDLRLVFRRSLQYLLARQVLRAFTLLPLAVLVIRALRDPGAPIGSMINVGGVMLVAAAALTLEFRDRIQAAIDRWFFRETLNREKAVRVLMADVARMKTWEEVGESVPPRLVSIFGLESAAIAADALLVVGPKKSEEALSEGERELLDLVGGQIALVREKLLVAEDRSSAVEAERRRIAREIHDTVGQGFAGIALYLDAARKTMSAGAPADAAQFLAEAGALARKSLRETRQTVAGWREPGGIDLEGRLRALARRGDAGAPVVDVQVQEGAARLAAPDVAWHLARIAEEAVTNACKHADARRIEIELRGEGTGLMLRVRDDGVGFDPAAQVAGYGLVGMRERMGQLHGELKIVSAPGQGTEVRAEVPAEVSAEVSA